MDPTLLACEMVDEMVAFGINGELIPCAGWGRFPHEHGFGIGDRAAGDQRICSPAHAPTGRGRAARGR